MTERKPRSGTILDFGLRILARPPRPALLGENIFTLRPQRLCGEMNWQKSMMLQQLLIAALRRE